MARSSSLKTKLLAFAVKVARLRFFQPLVSFFLNHMDYLRAVDQICSNANWVAFHHPSPDYPLHILIIPRKNLPALINAPDVDPDLYSDLFRLIKLLIAKFKLEKSSYQLITNGGEKQSIPQWHFHLISEVPGKQNA